MAQSSYSLLILLVLASFAFAEESTSTSQSDLLASVAPKPSRFSGKDTEETIVSRGAARVSNGTTSFYIGYEQISKNNQNPIVVKFTNGNRDWVRRDYETSNTDGKGYGLLWDGKENLYGVFSVDGTQGSPEQDFRRFCKKGWLKSYGMGGRAKVAVLVKLNPETGEGIEGACTFVTAQKKDGKSNSVKVTDIRFGQDGSIVVTGDSAFNPRRADRTRMEQTEPVPGPIRYRIAFNPQLTDALFARAVGWDGCTSLDGESAPQQSQNNQ